MRRIEASRVLGENEAHRGLLGMLERNMRRIEASWVCGTLTMRRIEASWVCRTVATRRIEASWVWEKERQRGAYMPPCQYTQGVYMGCVPWGIPGCVHRVVYSRVYSLVHLLVYTRVYSLVHLPTTPWVYHRRYTPPYHTSLGTPAVHPSVLARCPVLHTHTRVPVEEALGSILRIIW